MIVVTGIGQALTAAPDREGAGLVANAALCLENGEIRYVGPEGEMPSIPVDAERVDAGGRLLTPGLVDCHAHPIFAGNRADEFAMRAAGKGYLEIAAAGGGIAATLGPTRSATLDEHVALTCGRMERALAHGTTTCEAKSGYDLSVDGELRLLEVARAANEKSAVDLSPTLLGAHVIPPERKDDRDAYVSEVVEQMIPRAASQGLAEAIDVYCDEGAYTLEEARRILEAGKHHGLIVRGHMGQFADLGGAELVAELGGRSVDHLEQVSDAGIKAIADAGVIAVMLPGACVQLRMEPPPVAKLRDAGVTLALASDMNPGSTAGESLPIQMWLGSTHYGMTVDECWLGVTRHAAAVLGRDTIGHLAPGMDADFILWDAESPAEIPYLYGRNLVSKVWKRGALVHA